MRDLRRHRHIVVRDSGSQRDRSVDGKRVYTVETPERWTVTNMATSIGAVCRGYGFAWLPIDKIRNELAAGEVKPLPVQRDRDRSVPLYLVFGDADAAGPGVSRLAQIIRDAVRAECAGKGGASQDAAKSRMT
jgi:DNA-binding transcriptional LysR family regulator